MQAALCMHTSKQNFNGVSDLQVMRLACVSICKLQFFTMPVEFNSHLELILNPVS